MSCHFRARIPSQVGNNNRLFYFLSPLCNQTRSKLSQTLISPAPEMEAETSSSSSSRRPMCPSCFKPSRLCLCSRIKTPILNNSVAVTILQHCLEKKHPLNSTRIATLGLKNLNVVLVSDVNFEARFLIRSPESGSDGSEVRISGSCGCQRHSNSSDFDLVCEGEGTQIKVFDKIDGSVDPEEEKSKSVDSELLSSNSKSNEEAILDRKIDFAHKKKQIRIGIEPIGEVPRGVEEPLITFTISKYGTISSLVHHWTQRTQCHSPDFDLLLASPVVLDDLAKGFVVKKWQSKQLNEGIIRTQEFEEFEIRVPAGSVLLFPSEKSVGVEAIDFKVKNLIVLDGTWAKARRMYNENPWLKLLPHLKLDLDKLSLYNEVRRQPRAGYLSTIESIVYALKAVGDKAEGLDNLLDVFESMVGDQRRCKDERLSRTSPL